MQTVSFSSLFPLYYWVFLRYNVLQLTCKLVSFLPSACIPKKMSLTKEVSILKKKKKQEIPEQIKGFASVDLHLLCCFHWWQWRTQYSFDSVQEISHCFILILEVMSQINSLCFCKLCPISLSWLKSLKFQHFFSFKMSDFSNVCQTSMLCLVQNVLHF